MTAFQPVARDHQDVLPLAPCWRVGRAHVLDSSPAQLTSELAGLAGEQAHYWVLQQGPLAPGSRRESLLNLDTDMALAAALGQTFRRADSPDSLIFQCMPPQRAAGVLFSRHPMRPDLDHIVIEGCLQGSDQQQRVILHADGALAWRSDGADAFLDELGTAAFHQLAQSLHDSYGEPRAAEWIWDGRRLWLVQALPIGTLPMPSEVWTRRAGLGFAAQAISPLWYTMMARWLKEGFWRVIGQRAGWRELGNIEPYRRQHSYLYGNARFFRALQQWQHGASLWWALPPAWRNRPAAPVRSDRDRPLSRAAFRLRLLWLRKRLQSSEPLAAEAPADEVWLALIRLDRLGEQLARIEGQLGYIQAPSVGARGTPPLPADVLSPDGVAELGALADVADGRLGWDTFCQRFSQHSAGADPVFPRLQEKAADVAALPSLLAQLPEQRRERLRQLAALPVRQGGWLALRRDAGQLRQQLAGQMRLLLKAMAQRLVALRRIRHPDDIFFLYFDELWQVWQGESRRQLETLLGERKVRYLSDAHAGPPDWIIDSIGYGTSPLGQTSAHDTVRGYALVPGRAEGRVQRLGSGWQLNQVQPGDILVLDQSDVGWLPWISLAGGLVLSHRDPLDPVAALAVALGIPTIWGVDDAMHCLPDGVTVALDGESGLVRQV